jgi:hypothetical protein
MAVLPSERIGNVLTCLILLLKTLCFDMKRRLIKRLIHEKASQKVNLDPYL